MSSKHLKEHPGKFALVFLFVVWETRKVMRLKYPIGFFGVVLLIATCAECSHMQRIDGWYNNLLQPSWGTAGEALLHNITPAYEDFTYKCMKNRPGARLVSNQIFQEATAQFSSFSLKRSALFAFFSQFVSLELTNTDDKTCPAEIVDVPVPACDLDFDPGCTGKIHIPYERTAYDKGTGQSPNSPRRQVNKATSFIDASFVYGTSTVRTNFLRKQGTGFLAGSDTWNRFPGSNDIGLPVETCPDAAGKMHDPTKLWMTGDPHAHENPGVLSLSVLFFRWHNVLAKRFQQNQSDLSPTDVFLKARRWVIACLQKIIMYDWLPFLVQQPIKNYTGYNPSLKPSITTIFDAAAMQYYSTLIPNTFQFRNKDTCKIDKEMQPLRLCRTFFNSEEILKNGPFIVEEILMGMASQNAAKDDFQIVEDLRSKWFGPLHFSRRDFVTYTIMRGRDFGLPDYNTARREMDLAEVPDFASINPALNKTNPEVFQKLQNLYKDVKHLDIFVGGMLETTGSGPGELFKMVILDQFYKIRDGDRFWFENEGVMRREEVQEVWNITLRDIILACSEIKSELLQPNVFTIDPVDPACSPINVNTSEMEACPQHKGFDYFAGSEISYIIIWVCFGLIPIVCILCAFIASKCRKWNHDRRKKKHIKHATKQNNQVEIRVNDDDEVRFSATEWQGPKEEERSVVIKLKADCVLEVTSSRGATLRKVNFQNRNTVEAWNSANKGRNVMVIKVPKECDMMFQFQSCAARTLFEKELRGMLMDHNLQLIMQEDKLRGLKKNLFTRSKRNALLEQFFKHVFSEAFDMDYDPSLEESDNMEGSNANEILQIELTKEEFAHALAVKPTSEFVENMFGLLDTNRNGYISFRDFLNAVVLFSKGSSQEKIRLIFRMFDVEDKDQLNKSQLIKMFRSLLEMANSNVVKEDIETLVESICLEHGLNDQSTIDFDDFCKILSPQMDKIWNSSLEWKGRKNCYPSQDRRKSIDVGMRKKSLSVGNLRRKSSESSDDIMSQKSGSLSTLNSSTKMITKFEAIREKYHPIKSKVKDLLHFFENNRQHIFYLILFFGITVGIFAERFYYYTVEREHSGLRALMSYGISVTRGAAGAMSFTFSLLLLTMCRNMITWLRSTILNQFIPFDSHVTFHKIVAWTALFFTGLHVIGYSFNFYHLATQPTSHLCIFDSIALRSDTLVNFNFWLFGNMTGFTGVLLVIIICIIYVFATQTARKHIFNGFWLTHKLISIMYILTILHGASRIVQKPLFFVYFIGPAILFAIDKLISLSRKKTEITVIRAEKLQSDITSLEFKRPSKFEYKSGQWVRIACVSQGRNEYHPFTLTSAPHEDTLKLHIRALGPWTWNIRNMYDPEVLKDEPFPKLYLDGPYGAGQQDWYQYEVSILVGAGIGVTPYASILKDFVHMAMMRSTYRMKCQKLYFVWVTASQRHYEWLLDIIREVEEVDEKGIVSVDIFITQFFQNFDLRTTMLYICEEHFQKLSGGHSVFTGLKASTHFGRPKLAEMFRTIHKTHPTARKVGVFSCGPAGVTSSVEAGCIEASNTTKALFEHHFENF